ncbi:MAG: hypothetical protein D6741_07265 [Planctomycetota bacterium]|nr:MAG: hypothetical protein D6741_07265 [Planctomycetota bacterium]
MDGKLHPPQTTTPAGNEGSSSHATTSHTRSCRGCTACCVWLPISPGVVSPGAKPAGIPCPLLSAEGCRAYSRRPQTCRDFVCSWYRCETWPEAWRPDRSQLLCLHEKLENGAIGALVYELAPSALQHPVAAEILTALRAESDFVVLVNVSGERSILRHDTPVSETEHPTVPRPHFPSRAKRKAVAPNYQSDATAEDTDG